MGLYNCFYISSCTTKKSNRLSCTSFVFLSDLHSQLITVIFSQCALKWRAQKFREDSVRFYHLRVTEGQHNHAAPSYCARCNCDLLWTTDKINFNAKKIRSYQNFLTFQAIYHYVTYLVLCMNYKLTLKLDSSWHDSLPSSHKIKINISSR